MPYWRTYYHFVWATKHRRPLITSNIESALYRYLVRQAIDMRTHVYAIDGWLDHVHIVASLPPTVAIMPFVKQLKGASSHYINTMHIPNTEFRWQVGYGVLTISHRNLNQAIAYVENQKQHHQENTISYWLEHSDNNNDGPRHHPNT